ncbi:MAG TPA: hypothetical protein VFS76_00495 [Pyrinomonadaceae bacterium]|nr:hypothetical protein [Pyrinomonadaceae bacterium]
MRSDFQAKQIADRFDKLTLLRLINVCESFIDDSAELADSTGFSDLWVNFSGIAPEALARIARHPLTYAWVFTAETLLKNGIHQRYPEAHPARHLKDFSRLLLSWATHLPDGASGALSVPGRRATQLSYGDYILCSEELVDLGDFTWKRDGERLRIGPAGSPIFECDVDFKQIHAVNAGCNLVTTPTAGRLKIDYWTPEYLRNSSEVPGDLEPRIAQIEIAMKELDPRLCSFVEDTARCISPPSARSRWISGLLRVPAEGIDAAMLVGLACRDSVERMMILHSVDQFVGAQSAGSDFHSAFVEVAARRLASRLLDHELLTSVPQENEWLALRGRLTQFEPGITLLEDLGEEVTSAPSGATTIPTTVPTNPVLQLPLPSLLFPDLPDELKLRKTRRGSAFTIDDFSAIDALADRSPSDLVRLWSELREDVSTRREDQAFLLGVTAYVMRRFDYSAGAFLRCLDFDADVEEYWHLLAFALRHLQHYDDFDRIMFNNLRDPSLLDHLSQYKR